MKFKLRRLDMNIITDDSVIVAIGKRRTGKSWVIRDLMYHKQNLQLGKVICPTERPSPFYSDFIPSVCIDDEYTPKKVNDILKRQKRIMNKIKKGDNDIDPNFFLIMDDCLYDDSWTKTKEMRNIFMNGRHYKILFVLAMQYVLGIPPMLRTNIDFVFLMRDNITSNRRRIYEQYAGMFPNFKFFEKVMNQCTENRECLVLHLSSLSNDLSNQVYWYKASDPGDFKMCPEFLWQQNDDEEESDEEYSDEMYQEKYVRHRNDPTIDVQKMSNNDGYNGY